MNAQHTPEAIRRKARKPGAHNPFGAIMKNSENQKPDGGPAFPAQFFDERATGMTLRDYFAAKAMQGLLSSETQAPAIEFAENAYLMADAMIKARQS